MGMSCRETEPSPPGRGRTCARQSMRGFLLAEANRLMDDGGPFTRSLAKLYRRSLRPENSGAREYVFLYALETGRLGELASRLDEPGSPPDGASAGLEPGGGVPAAEACAAVLALADGYSGDAEGFLRDNYGALGGRYRQVADAFDHVTREKARHGLLKATWSEETRSALGESGESVYSLAKRTGVNNGNACAYLRGDLSKLSLETARRLLAAAEGGRRARSMLALVPSADAREEAARTGWTPSAADRAVLAFHSGGCLAGRLDALDAIAAEDAGGALGAALGEYTALVRRVLALGGRGGAWVSEDGASHGDLDAARASSLRGGLPFTVERVGDSGSVEFGVSCAGDGEVMSAWGGGIDAKGAFLEAYVAGMPNPFDEGDAVVGVGPWSAMGECVVATPRARWDDLDRRFASGGLQRADFGDASVVVVPAGSAPGGAAHRHVPPIYLERAGGTREADDGRR